MRFNYFYLVIESAQCPARFDCVYSPIKRTIFWLLVRWSKEIREIINISREINVSSIMKQVWIILYIGEMLSIYKSIYILFIFYAYEYDTTIHIPITLLSEPANSIKFS